MKKSPNEMADTTDVLVEDGRWQSVALQELAEKSFAAVFAERGLDIAGYEISLLACDDVKIAALNAEFRKLGSPTNVLSWPALDLAPEQPGAEPKPPLQPTGPFSSVDLGNIAISYETCAQEAAGAGIPFEHHICHLLIHSCLHLLGYGHKTDADAARMQGIETKILASMGVKDPY